MVAQWYYQTAERQPSGPIDSKELRRLAEAGIVRPDTLVRQGEKASWVRAERVRGLFQRTTPPPPSSSMVKATLVQPPAPPPLPSALRESGWPSRSVGGESPVRHGPGASAVNEASEKRDRIHPSTLVAIIAGTGFVLLLLWTIAFRGGGAPQQVENDQLPSVVAQSAESKDTVVATPGDGSLIANDGDSSVIASQTSQSTASEARVIRDPATLFENSRIAVATILTKDSEGYDSRQGSGFFINISQVEQFKPTLFEAFKEDEKWPRGGYLLTNYHVIRAAATAKVRVHDFGVQLDANIGEVVMEREDLDLALVSVSLWPPKKQEAPSKGADGSELFDGLDWGLAESKIPWWKRSVPTLEIADREDPVVGTKVYAIGSPQGLEATFSEGIVSGFRSGSEGLPRLQFSAPVSPGSSGGPLVDEAGQVVGVVTALHRGGQNLNFAVPAAEVRDFLKGQCNSRELWRGTSIDDEADDALYAVLRASRGADERKKYELAAIIRVVDVARSTNTTAKQYRESLETLLSIEPSSCGDFEYLLYYARGKASIEIATLDIFENRAPPVPESERNLPAQQQVALQLNRSSDHQAGIRFLTHSIQLNPKFPPSHHRLHDALSMTGQYAEALLAADRLVQLVPRCSKAHDARGSALKELAQVNLALKAYQIAAELSPANPSYYASLGRIYDKLGVQDKAIESYEASIRLGDASAHTCMQLAFVLQKAGRFSEAIVKFQEARANFLARGFQDTVDICDRSIAECRAKKRP